MRTEVFRVTAEAPEEEAVRRAAEVLRAGGLVAFPTETVYGLGANALDARAVAGIFAAKGRPAYNPLIVHLPDVEAAARVVAVWPERAALLAARFWPGPLTLVLPRAPEIPDIVTAGGPTVGLRVPAHPVALALLWAVGVPIAAPSANRSLQLSPTRAEHVLEGLNGRIDLLLDGGPTTGGLESTVLDLTTEPPTLLRPGLIAPAEIEAVIGPLARPGAQSATAPDTPLRAPGQLSRHYAPRAPLEISAEAEARAEALHQAGERVGLLLLETNRSAVKQETAPVAANKGTAAENRIIVGMPASPEAYASRLYAELHALDRAGATRIVVERPPEGEGWLAIHDRLRRAAAPPEP